MAKKPDVIQAKLEETKSSYILDYSYKGKQVVLTGGFSLVQKESRLKGKLVSSSFETSVLPEKLLLKIAKKLGVEYAPEAKRYTLITNRSLSKVETARWYYDNKGGEYLKKSEILKVAVPLLGSKVKVRKNADT